MVSSYNNLIFGKGRITTTTTTTTTLAPTTTSTTTTLAPTTTTTTIPFYSVQIYLSKKENIAQNVKIWFSTDGGVNWNFWTTGAPNTYPNYNSFSGLSFISGTSPVFGITNISDTNVSYGIGQGSGDFTSLCGLSSPYIVNNISVNTTVYLNLDTDTSNYITCPITTTTTSTTTTLAPTTTSTTTTLAPTTTTTTTTSAPNPACEDVTIGTQTWTRCNLNVDTYRDNTVIPQAATLLEWSSATTGLWTYYDSNPANGPIYGKLYNWYAVMGIWQTESYPPTPEELAARKPIAPAGYHVPSDAEWTTLTTFLGGESVAGGKMKSTGTIQAGTGLWDSPNIGATNSSGFTGLPGGYRDFDGDFNFSIGSLGLWWSSTEFVDEEGDSYSAYRYFLQTNQSYISRLTAGKNLGFSVRLIKDSLDCSLTGGGTAEYVEPIVLDPFDYMIVTYNYDNSLGNRDLDSATTFRNTGTVEDNKFVGCGQTSQYATPTPETLLNDAYLFQGGDDNENGQGESIVINFKNLELANISVNNNVTVELYAGWCVEPASLTTNVSVITYLGGTMSITPGGNTITSTGTVVATFSSTDIPVISGCCGVDPILLKTHIGTISYNLVTKVSSVVFY